MLVVTIVIVGAFFLESLFGFGGGMVSIPILTFLLPLPQAVTLVLFFQLGLAILSANSLRGIEWKIVMALLPGLLFGTEVGIRTSRLIPEWSLRKGMALALLFYLSRRFVRRRQFTSKSPLARACFVGAIGGYLQAAIGIGGPVLSVFLRDRIEGQIPFRSTIIVVFAISSVCRLHRLLWAGEVSGECLQTVLMICPVFIPVVILGNRIQLRMNPRFFAIAIDVLHGIASLHLFLS